MEDSWHLADQHKVHLSIYKLLAKSIPNILDTNSDLHEYIAGRMPYNLSPDEDNWYVQEYIGLVLQYIVCEREDVDHARSDAARVRDDTNRAKDKTLAT